MDKNFTGKETSKGNKVFKYNIYDSKNCFYKKFMVHGEREHGNLRKGDKGISFLYNGKARNSKLSLEKEKNFFIKYMKYKNNFDYKLIIEFLAELSDRF